MYYNLFSRPIKIAPYFRGLQKFATLEQLEAGLYKIPVKIRTNNFRIQSCVLHHSTL